ncbi:hypothetical protein ANN_07216 [Periplaneta americana]|uniref:Mos1 transposase HTH domain-containing protein n=1 Tax=Periplaneta americana TaxID=6978 RepID=A0ABQ8THK0_PERAM|nr:hypothetical protein ANN_07216 [Periplaneta americana]
MKKTISNPESCEVRAVIRFLHAKSLNAAEIHRQLCVVYGPNVMSQRKVSSWCKQFSEGRTNVHDEERSGRPSIVSDDIIEQVTNKMCENRRLTISELTSHFPHISRSLIHEIVTRRFQYHKVHGMWIPKMIGTYSLEEERMDSAFNFLERLFSVDEIGDSEMRPRIRHRLPGIHLTVEENLGKNLTSYLSVTRTLHWNDAATE